MSYSPNNRPAQLCRVTGKMTLWLKQLEIQGAGRKENETLLLPSVKRKIIVTSVQIVRKPSPRTVSISIKIITMGERDGLNSESAITMGIYGR
jgi:hypothetical protein